MIRKTLSTDFLIIGSGAAGLNAALHAGKYGNVLLVTKSSRLASSSYHAQGGIAAVLAPPDSFQNHKRDTINAGRHFCNIEAVDVLVEEGPAEIRRLIEQGMSFDRSGESWDLSLEGGHSNRRVLHANGAATGQALVNFLARQVDERANIDIIEESFVFDLIMHKGQCMGARAYHNPANQFLRIQSSVTILATGGYAGLYERSTNPHTSTGDGLWLAYEAGAQLRDLEFVQFHPTAFYDPVCGSFLISEALRGEGAKLYNQRGERFMADIEGGELAPRDVVSREIFYQIQNQQADFVYLDVRHLRVKELRSHFPHLCKRIEKRGINIRREGIPVAPAAHYCIGGIVSDLHGQTALPGLYACGEVAATGVHGANRLASNSLLECLVFSKRAVEHAATTEIKKFSSADIRFRVNDNHAKAFLELKQAVAGLLSRQAGISRCESGLENARNTLKEWPNLELKDEDEYYSIRAEGLVRIAKMLVEAALRRRQSLGVHFRSDSPEIAHRSNGHNLTA